MQLFSTEINEMHKRVYKLKENLDVKNRNQNEFPVKRQIS